MNLADSIRAIPDYPTPGIIFRDINMKRTFIDQCFSRMINGHAGIIINTGEDNYLTTADAFEAAARRGSISAAARELSVTHGAISHQIRSLEETLKTALFERGGKRLKLTPQGALLLPAVTQAFDGIAAATALMNRPSTSGSLRISCVPALLSLWLVPRLGSFVDRYPEISLTLTSSNDSNLIYSPDIDIAIL